MSNTGASNVTISDPLFQNAYYIGNNFNGILYGVELVLYVTSMKTLLESRKRHKKASDLFFMWFSTTLLVLTTIYMAVESVFGEEMWIVNAEFPGGDGAYLATYASVWYQTMGTAASFALNLLSDGLLIYRCYVVWNDRRVIVFPGILYIGTLGLGIAQLYASGVPSGDFFAGVAADLGLAYYATTVGLNVIVTSLICGQILFWARRTRVVLGEDAARTYTGVAAILIESALPYTLCGIALLVSYGLNSEISILFLSLYVMSTCIAPQLIILRVTTGRGWTKEKVSQSLSTLSFSSRSRPRPFVPNSSVTAINLQNISKSSPSTIIIANV
ncbi:hypothetical protein BKA93DRAFT_729653 [Sparassis latifolia]